CGEDGVEPGHLRDAEGGAELREAVIARGLAEDAGGFLAMVAQRAEPSCDGLVVAQTRSPLAGRDDLARVEAQAGDDADAAAGAEVRAAADRAGRVLDDHEVGQGVEDLPGPDGIAKLVDDDSGAGALRARRRERVADGVPLARVDVDEHGGRPHHADGARRARPGERGTEDLVARADPYGAQRELER